MRLGKKFDIVRRSESIPRCSLLLLCTRLPLTIQERTRPSGGLCIPPPFMRLLLVGNIDLHGQAPTCQLRHVPRKHTRHCRECNACCALDHLFPKCRSAALFFGGGLLGLHIPLRRRCSVIRLQKRACLGRWRLLTWRGRVKVVMVLAVVEVLRVAVDQCIVACAHRFPWTGLTCQMRATSHRQ